MHCRHEEGREDDQSTGFHHRHIATKPESPTHQPRPDRRPPTHPSLALLATLDNTLRHFNHAEELFVGQRMIAEGIGRFGVVEEVGWVMGGEEEEMGEGGEGLGVALSLTSGEGRMAGAGGELGQRMEAKSQHRETHRPIPAYTAASWLHPSGSL